LCTYDNPIQTIKQTGSDLTRSIEYITTSL
jgi:hypothetical protein